VTKEKMATAGDGEKRWPHKCVYKPTRSPLTSLSFGLGLGGVFLLPTYTWDYTLPGGGHTIGSEWSRSAM
jgi:hypothetical protein